MEVIAERKFTLKSDPAALVVARLFRPVPKGDDFKCEYEIEWPGSKERGRAFGVDAIQALLLALQRIGIDVYCSQHAKSGDLVWLEEGRGFGLMLPANLAELYQGDDPPT